MPLANLDNPFGVNCEFVFDDFLKKNSNQVIPAITSWTSANANLTF